MLGREEAVVLDCKTVVFFANASDGAYSNKRSGGSVKTARENGVRLARFTLEDHAYGASRLPKTSENDCFAVYRCLDREATERARKSRY